MKNEQQNHWKLEARLAIISVITIVLIVSAWTTYLKVRINGSADGSAGGIYGVITLFALLYLLIPLLCLTHARVRPLYLFLFLIFVSALMFYFASGILLPYFVSLALEIAIVMLIYDDHKMGKSTA